MHVGQRVEIYLDNNTVFPGSVASLHNNGILVGINNYNEFPDDLSNKNIRVVMFENGFLNYFSGEVKRKIKSTNLILFTYPQDLKKIERRNFYRVRIWEEIKVFFNDRDTQKLPAWLRFDGFHSIDISALPKGYKEGRLFDIGGGGLCMATREHVKENKFVGIVLCIDKEPLKLKAHVTASIKDKKIFKTSVQFENLSQIDSDKIMRFVFERESGWLRSKSREASVELLALDNTGKIRSDKKSAVGNRHFRLPNIAIPVEYKVVRDFSDIASVHYDQAIIRNLSFTGASIIVNDLVEDGAEIWLRMNVAGSNIRLLAKSVRCRDLQDVERFELGLKFQAADMESSKQLVSFMYNEHNKQMKEAASFLKEGDKLPS